MQIKNIAPARAESLYDSNKSVRIPSRDKANTSVLRSNKSPKRAHNRHHGIHRYCLLCKKAGMPERKYTLHSSEDCTGVRIGRSIKSVMGGPIGSRTDAVNQYKKYEKKWKKELKALNN